MLWIYDCRGCIYSVHLGFYYLHALDHFSAWFLQSYSDMLTKAQPTTTGLENMPAFGTSLGCEDAPFIFSSHSEASYAIPIGSQQSFEFSLAGEGVSTLELFSTTGDNVLVEMVLRTDDEANLKGVDLKYGGRLGDSAGFFNLAMPSMLAGGSCMRVDMKVYIPTKLRRLLLDSRPLTHLKFPSKNDVPNGGQLEELSIALRSTLENNVFLSSLALPARRTTIEQHGGYLAGSVALLDNTHIITRETAITYLAVHSIKVSEDWYPRLVTDTGHGRTTFTYVNKDWRPIDAQHQSVGGDLYLQYGGTWFSGPVEIDARSSTTWNVNSDATVYPRHHWVRSRFGSDRLYARTPGWVGLYF